MTIQDPVRRAETLGLFARTLLLVLQCRDHELSMARGGGLDTGPDLGTHTLNPSAVADAHTVSLTLKAVWWADNPGPSCHYESRTEFVKGGVDLTVIRERLESMGLRVLQ